MTNPVQRTDRTRSFVCGVETIGFFQSLGVYRDDRVDLWSFLVEGIDAIEIHLNQLAASEPPGFVGAVNIFDGGFKNIERCWLSHWEISFTRSAVWIMPL